MRMLSQLASVVTFCLVFAMLSPHANAQCPPGPFSCVPWPSPGTPKPKPKPPPGPFEPGPLLVISPDRKVTNKSLEELIKGRADIVPFRLEDKELIRSQISEGIIKTIDPDKSYYLPRPDSKGFVFRGREVRP